MQYFQNEDDGSYKYAMGRLLIYGSTKGNECCIKQAKPFFVQKSVQAGRALLSIELHIR